MSPYSSQITASTGPAFWLYERLMGKAARERAAQILGLSPAQIERIEVIEVWGPPAGSGPERVVHFYDFGGRMLALSQSAAA